MSTQVYVLCSLSFLSVHVLAEEGFRPAKCTASSCWQMEASWNTLMTPARNLNYQLVNHVQKLIVLLSWSSENGQRWAALSSGEPNPAVATWALKVSAWVNKMFGAINSQVAGGFTKHVPGLSCAHSCSASLPRARLITAPFLSCVSVAEGQAIMHCMHSTRHV